MYVYLILWLIECFELVSVLGQEGACSSQCISERSEFHECLSIQHANQAAGANPVTLTFAGSVAADDAIIIENVLAVLCQRLQPQWNSTATPPYCATVVEIEDSSTPTEVVECPSECMERNGCYQLSLYVFEGEQRPMIPSANVVTALLDTSSLLALHLAGLPLLRVSTVSSGGILTEVPIGSWVCVGLGIVVSFITLTKPLWWDWGFRRIKRC